MVLLLKFLKATNLKKKKDKEKKVKIKVKK